MSIDELNAEATKVIQDICAMLYSISVQLLAIKWRGMDGEGI